MSLLKSALIHLFFAALIFALVSERALISTVEPIELVDLIQKQGNKTSTTPPKKAPRTHETPPLSSSSSESAPSAANSTSNPSNSDASSGVYEDYEASELPILLNMVSIRYPFEAKSKGIQGSVVFKLVVDQNGNVTRADVISSPSELLSKPAYDAVRQFKFKPARLNDKNVAIQFRYTYRFELE